MAIPPGPGSRNPLHGDAFAPQNKSSTGQNPVVLPHMPPKPENATRREPEVNVKNAMETTQDEMETGRAANEQWEKRAEAEHEAGRRAIARRTGNTRESGEPKRLEHKEPLNRE